LTNPAILQRPFLSGQKKAKKEKRKEEKGKAYRTHVMGYPIDRVGVG
jgi:hypothetical protein